MHTSNGILSNESIQNSQDLLQNILSYFERHHYSKDILPPIYISGCPNSCTTQQTDKIGLVGKKKRIDGTLCDVVGLSFSSSSQEDKMQLGTLFGDIRKEHIPIVLYKVATQIEESGLDFDTWIENHIFNLAVLLSDYLV